MSQTRPIAYQEPQPALSAPSAGTNRLPAWFAQAFAHLGHADRLTVQRLWFEEPALRTLTLLLDTLHPDNVRLRSCPACGSYALQLGGERGTSQLRASCTACGNEFSLTRGTPFYRIHRRNYRALYGTAVLLWGPWTPYFAWKIAGCTDAKQLTDFRRRLAPLFTEFGDMPLVSYPAYRLAFTPAQQGVRCLRCGADHLVYRKRHNPANPTFQCTSCNYHFMLRASRRHLLPLPVGMACPSCCGQSLNRKTVDAHGRGHYQCRDCGRHFAMIRITSCAKAPNTEHA
jgi:transposase-like protein